MGALSAVIACEAACMTQPDMYVTVEGWFFILYISFRARKE
jgi:hypothetical protein